jgi:cytochrome c oxidase subunit 2
VNGIAKRTLAIVLAFLYSTTLIARSVVPPQRFTIAAKRFSFRPEEITVQKGRAVTLELTSLDVTHGLKCKELGFNVTIHKGQTTEVEFTPVEAGRFVGRCSHFCGIGHGSMTLVINVVDK